MPVNAALFEKGFGISWKQVLADGNVYNALDACKVLGVDAAGLDALWATAKKVKLGGGFYAGLVSAPGKAPVYVFNGAFRSQLLQAVAQCSTPPSLRRCLPMTCCESACCGGRCYCAWASAAISSLTLYGGGALTPVIVPVNRSLITPSQQVFSWR